VTVTFAADGESAGVVDLVRALEEYERAAQHYGEEAARRKREVERLQNAEIDRAEDVRTALAKRIGPVRGRRVAVTMPDGSVRLFRVEQIGRTFCERRSAWIPEHWTVKSEMFEPAK
jgi:hypothetical protein